MGLWQRRNSAGPRIGNRDLRVPQRRRCSNQSDYARVFAILRQHLIRPHRSQHIKPALTRERQVAKHIFFISSMSIETGDLETIMRMVRRREHMGLYAT